MKKILAIVLVLISVIGYSKEYQNSCTKYYAENAEEINKKSESSKKSMFSVHSKCLSDEISDPNFIKNKITYSSFIECCYYLKSWHYQKAVDAYKQAVKNEVELDDKTKQLALFCFANSGNYVLKSGEKTLNEKLQDELNIFINLFEEMIPQNQSLICLRAIVYRKITNCYQYTNNDEFLKYQILYNENKIDCDSCCQKFTLK